MHPSRGAMLLGLIAGVAFTSPTRAQTLEKPRPRQGYYLSLGGGAAITRVSEDGESLGVWSGSTYALRVGQLLTSNLGLGIEIHFGGTKSGPDSAGFGGLALEGQWEMIENLALRGGFGLAVMSLTNSDLPDEDPRGSFGAGYTLALGYDLFFSKSNPSGGFAVTPLLGARYWPGDDSVQSVIGFVGLEISYWTGLPDNQLEFAPGDGYSRK